MTDVLDADPGLDEAVPAGDPAPAPQSFTWSQMFGINYREIVNELLAGTPQTGGNTYNKIDQQQMRLKAADIAANVTHLMFSRGQA